MAEEYKPSKKEIEARSLVQDSVKRAKAYQEPIFNKFLRFYLLYRNIQQESQWPFRNNIFVPVVFSTIETLMPRVILNQPKITILPREAGDDKFVEPSRQLVDYDWEQQEIGIECVDWFKQNWLYGTSLIKVRWVSEKRRVPRKSSFGKILFGKYKTVSENYPEVETVDNFDILIDPDADKVKKAKFIIHQLYIPEEELKENREGVYKNLQFVSSGRIEGDYRAERWRIHELSNKQRGRVIVSQGGVGLATYQDFDKFVKIQECYFRSSEKYPMGRLIVLANDNIVIRDTFNPYWYLDGEFPFIEIKDQPVPKEFWGIGEIEPIEGLQYERNHIRNRRMDSAEECMDKMWRVDPDSEVDENELVWQPNGIVHAKRGEVDVIEAGNPSQAGYQEEDINKQDTQVASGISDFTRGQITKGFTETATGIVSLVNEANQRFALKIKLIGEMGIKRLVKMLLQMEEYNLDKKRVVRIVGKSGYKFQEIKPDQIKSNLDIKVEIDPWPLINKSYQREQIMAVAKMFGNDPTINQKALKELVLDEFVDNKSKIEEILTPPAPAASPVPAALPAEEGGATAEGGQGIISKLLGKLPRNISLLQKTEEQKAEAPEAVPKAVPKTTPAKIELPKAKLPSNIPLK